MRENRAHCKGHEGSKSSPIAYMLIDIINLLVWPIVFLVFTLIFKNEIGEFISRLSLKEFSIAEKFKAVFNKQYKVVKEKVASQNILYENIYKKLTGAQLKFLEVLRESMRGGGRGMDCGYVSRYFINIIGTKTDRYDGWITPFITAYLQENGLVKVSDNFFILEDKGFNFLDYLDKMKYPLTKKTL